MHFLRVLPYIISYHFLYCVNIMDTLYMYLISHLAKRISKQQPRYVKKKRRHATFIKVNRCVSIFKSHKINYAKYQR